MAEQTPSKTPEKEPSKAPPGAPKGKKPPDSDTVHNVIGQVCSLIKDDKNRTRCEAGKKLYDAFAAESKAVAEAGAGIATAETGVGPLVFGLRSVYHQFQAADSLVAGVRQAITGKETQTVEEIIKEKLKKKAKEKLKELGTWIKKKWKGEDKDEKKKDEEKKEDKPQDKPQDKPADAPKETPAEKPPAGPMDPNQPVLDPNAPGPNPTPQDIESIPMV